MFHPPTLCLRHRISEVGITSIDDTTAASSSYRGWVNASLAELRFWRKCMNMNANRTLSVVTLWFTGFARRRRWVGLSSIRREWSLVVDDRTLWPTRICKQLCAKTRKLKIGLTYILDQLSSKGGSPVLIIYNANHSKLQNSDFICVQTYILFICNLKKSEISFIGTKDKINYHGDQLLWGTSIGLSKH